MMLDHWGEKEDIYWVFGILLEKTLEIDYSIFLTLWKQKFVHRHAMCLELDHLPSSPSSCSPLTLCIRFVHGQAPCWQQSVLPYERAAFDFPQSLSPHFPSWNLAELLAVPVQHSKPSKAWDEPVWFIMEHSSFEVCIWSKRYARPELANNQSGNSWKRIISPPYLCFIYKSEHQFLPPFCQPDLTLLQCCTLPWRINVNWWGISVVSVHCEEGV